MASEPPSQLPVEAPEPKLQTQQTTEQVTADGEAKPMSKKALKRMRKQEKWDNGIEERRQKRRDKRVERRARNRADREAQIAAGADPASFVLQRTPATLVPVTLLFDCDFEKYMTEKEGISLSSQVTRAYSDNRNAKYRSHLWIAGFNGRLQQRFDGTLRSVQKNWKGVNFHEGNFLEAAVKARQGMVDKPGEMIPSLQKSVDEPVAWTKDPVDPFPLDEPEPPLSEEYKDVVYLSSDSPYTLERLEPHTSYVIGGLVDKNREKGLCYRRARELGIRTARLPIGEFMVMQSRTVLATNHVVDIMLKWLEFEDWGKAFVAVIPKRKGGRLKGEDGEEEENHDEGEEEEQQEENVNEEEEPQDEAGEPVTDESKTQS